MSVDPCANVMPVLGGFIRRPKTRLRDKEEPVRESQTRRIIDAKFEASTMRLSTLKNRSSEVVVLAWSPSGLRTKSLVNSTYIGSGHDLASAMDSLTKHDGKGMDFMDAMLDYGSVLFIGDGNYQLKRVICRDSRVLLNAKKTGLLRELQEIFRLPDVNINVGFNNGQYGKPQSKNLASLLGLDTEAEAA